MKLPKINGKTVKEQVEWLKKEDCGCYHFHLTDTDNYRMHICIGWHDYGEGHIEMSKDGSYPLQKWVEDPNSWRITWKIGMETFNNAMQTDLDIDFIMPYDEESGDVYDTESEIGEITTMKGWNALAAEMNKTATEVVKWQTEYEKKKNTEAA